MEAWKMRRHKGISRDVGIEEQRGSLDDLLV